MTPLNKNIDAIALRDLFIARECPGIAALIERAEQEHLVSISDMNIPDPDDLLDGVTNAVMKSFGIKGQFISSAQARQFLFGISAKDAQETGVAVSGIEIGPFWDPNGRHVPCTPLQWLEALSRALPDLSQPAIKAIDGFCAERATQKAALDPGTDMTLVNL